MSLSLYIVSIKPAHECHESLTVDFLSPTHWDSVPVSHTESCSQNFSIKAESKVFFFFFFFFSGYKLYCHIWKDLTFGVWIGLTTFKTMFTVLDPPPKKMVLTATVPKEFNFNTNTRVKATTSSNTAHKEVDFITQLRKPSSPVSPLWMQSPSSYVADCGAEVFNPRSSVVHLAWVQADPRNLGS